ncbi:MAG: osmotically inducible protein OsmC [Chloroflexi bacterium RBG_16_47_49]|nr:MAG: osmotically inducible protein OsmC [Chloroflexi bacterium RBG_16_47_49]
MEAKVIWNNKLSFTGNAANAFTVPLDAEPAVGGENNGFEPMELIAIGLAGCTAMDTISILQKKRQDVTAFQVQVHAERADEYPKVFTRITIEYLVEGRKVDPKAVERSIELSATKYCPAQAMLSKVCTIEHRYTIKDAN